MGNGTHAFTLDPQLGEWVLSHPNLKIPATTREFAINASNSRFWEPPVKRYVDECLAGKTGPRGADFNMRWIASLVAETHRILMRGGVFMYPRDTKDPTKPGRLRLLYEANPISLPDRAGRRPGQHRPQARARACSPSALHQRIGFVFGSREEVERIERYHHDEPQDTYSRRCSASAACSPNASLTSAALATTRVRVPHARRSHFQELAMSAKHPIIAITGSSGAGTTSVTRTFENIFRREKRATPPSSRATASTATTARR